MALQPKKRLMTVLLAQTHHTSHTDICIYLSGFYPHMDSG